MFAHLHPCHQFLSVTSVLIFTYYFKTNGLFWNNSGKHSSQVGLISTNCVQRTSYMLWNIFSLWGFLISKSATVLFGGKRFPFCLINFSFSGEKGRITWNTWVCIFQVSTTHMMLVAEKGVVSHGRAGIKRIFVEQGSQHQKCRLLVTWIFVDQGSPHQTWCLLVTWVFVEQGSQHQKRCWLVTWIYQIIEQTVQCQTCCLLVAWSFTEKSNWEPHSFWEPQ